MAGELRPRWGQPMTGIISTIAFFLDRLVYLVSFQRSAWTGRLYFRIRFVLILALDDSGGFMAAHVFWVTGRFRKLSPSRQRGSDCNYCEP